MLISTVYAQSGEISESTNAEVEFLMNPLYWTELSLLILVLLAAPIYAIFAQRGSSLSVPLRGLSLPKGSVRAILALLIVGSFVNVLVFGANVLGENFDQVITAFGTLAGAVTGFYFAGRSAEPANEEVSPRVSENSEPLANSDTIAEKPAG